MNHNKARIATRRWVYWTLSIVALGTALAFYSGFASRHFTQFKRHAASVNAVQGEKALHEEAANGHAEADQPTASPDNTRYPASAAAINQASTPSSTPVRVCNETTREPVPYVDVSVRTAGAEEMVAAAADLGIAHFPLTRSATSAGTFNVTDAGNQVQIGRVVTTGDMIELLVKIGPVIQFDTMGLDSEQLNEAVVAHVSPGIVLERNQPFCGGGSTSRLRSKKMPGLGSLPWIRLPAPVGIEQPAADQRLILSAVGSERVAAATLRLETGVTNYVVAARFAASGGLRLAVRDTGGNRVKKCVARISGVSEGPDGWDFEQAIAPQATELNAMQLLPGLYVCEIGGVDYIAQSKEIVVVAGQIATIDCTLTRKATTKKQCVIVNRNGIASGGCMISVSDDQTLGTRRHLETRVAFLAGEHEKRIELSLTEGDLTSISYVPDGLARVEPLEYVGYALADELVFNVTVDELVRSLSVHAYDVQTGDPIGQIVVSAQYEGVPTSDLCCSPRSRYRFANRSMSCGTEVLEYGHLNRPESLIVSAVGYAPTVIATRDLTAMPNGGRIDVGLRRGWGAVCWAVVASGRGTLEPAIAADIVADGAVIGTFDGTRGVRVELQRSPIEVGAVWNRRSMPAIVGQELGLQCQARNVLFFRAEAR